MSIECQFCFLYSTDKKENLRKHWAKYHLEEAVQEGLMRQPKHKNERLNEDELIQVKELVKQLDNNEQATISDFSVGKVNPKQDQSNVPFLKLCIPSVSGREMNMDKNQTIKSLSDMVNKHKNDVVFISMQSLHQSLVSQGFTEDQIKPIIKESIKNVKSSSSTRGFEEKIIQLYNDINNKMNVWNDALATKIDEMNTILQSPNNTFNIYHSSLAQDLNNMTNLEQLENEILFSEFYYIKAMSRRLQVSTKSQYVEFLKHCLDEMKMEG
jgi:hypothetical protein